jgi:8-oxo-dGTP diphosphatase
MTRFSLITDISLLLERDGHIFLVRRTNTGFQDGYYCLPAGHKEEGESAAAAIIREAKEEVDIDIDPADLDFIHVTHRTSDGERVSFYFQPRTWVGEPRNAEPHKADDAGWFPLSALPENIMDFQKAALAEIRAGKMYSERGW